MPRVNCLPPARTLGASLLAVLVAGAVSAAAAGGAPTPPAGTPGAHPGFAVLARSCFKCHGEGTRLSGLDLRTRELALKGGKHGAALVPGKAAASRLFRMVLGKHKPQMPPTGALPDAAAAAIRWSS